MNQLKILVGEMHDYKYNILSYYLKETGNHEIIRKTSLAGVINHLCIETPDLLILGNQISTVEPDAMLLDEDILHASEIENWLKVLHWMKGFYCKKNYKVPVILHVDETFDVSNLPEVAHDFVIATTIFSPRIEKNQFIEILEKVKPIEKKKHASRPKVAKFEKVPLEEFVQEMNQTFPIHKFMSGELKEMWKNIKLPRRSTHDSAGYDFFTPFSFNLVPGTSIKIPTGIRAVFTNPDWGLFMLPRSGIGTKTGIRLTNTIGVIDADYFLSKNTGHIMIRLDYPANPSVPSFLQKFGEALGILRHDIVFPIGKAFVQGTFLPYGITIDDDEYEKEDRWGEFGSTDNTLRPPHHHHRPPKPDHGCHHPNRPKPPVNKIPKVPEKLLKELTKANLLEFFVDRTDIINGSVEPGDRENLKSTLNVLNSVKYQKSDIDPLTGFIWGEKEKDEVSISDLEYEFEFPHDGDYIIRLEYMTHGVLNDLVYFSLPKEIKTSYDYMANKPSEDVIHINTYHVTKTKPNSIEIRARLHIKSDECGPIRFIIPNWNSKYMSLVSILIYDDPSGDDSNVTEE